MKSVTSTEIVILITPRIVNYAASQPEENTIRRVDVIKQIIDTELGETERDMERVFDGRQNGNGDVSDRR